MSELATLARPYAEAVFKRALETDSTAKWSEMLAFLTAVMNDKDISVSTDNPRVNHDRLTQLMLDICQGHINEEGVNFVKLLVENKRLTLVPTISHLYEGYKAEHEGYVEVDVTTAYVLTKDEENKFASSLGKTLNRKVHMHMKVDKSLIGGVLVRAGDTVIDGSIKGQLQQLAKRL